MNKRTYMKLIIITLLLLFPSFSFAINPIDNPNDFKPGDITSGDTDVITSKANQIVGAIVTVGVVVSAITLTILGIKYMLGSVEEKAEYKKSMVPYIIGSVLLFATSSILGVIGKLIEGINF